MDKNLYEALQEAAKRKHGNMSVLSPKSEGVEDRKAFDLLVLALHKLRELGFVQFRDKGQVLKDNMDNDYSYRGIACEFTYDGEKVLSYGSYDAYLKSLPTTQPLGINVDQSFKNYGSISGSNVAVHSNQVNQTISENSEIEKFFQQIIETLQQDATLTQTKLQELMEDVQSLKKELQRANPRPRILTELYSFFGNTASIAGYLPQLRELIQPFIS